MKNEDNIFFGGKKYIKKYIDAENVFNIIGLDDRSVSILTAYMHF